MTRILVCIVLLVEHRTHRSLRLAGDETLGMGQKYVYVCLRARVMGSATRAAEQAPTS